MIWETIPFFANLDKASLRTCDKTFGNIAKHYCSLLRTKEWPNPKASSVQGRNEGSKGDTIARAPMHYGSAESLRCAPNDCRWRRKFPTMSQVLQYICFHNTSGSNMGAYKFAFCFGRHLILLRPCACLFETLIPRRWGKLNWPDLWKITFVFFNAGPFILFLFVGKHGHLFKLHELSRLILKPQCVQWRHIRSIKLTVLKL